MAPARIGSLPSRLDASIRSLVKWTEALIPGTLGASSASWTAVASGLAGGFGPPPEVASATAVPPITMTSASAQIERSRRVEMRRRKFKAASW